MSAVPNGRRRGWAAMAAVLVAALVVPAVPAQGRSERPVYLDTRHTFAERAADLVSRMTLSEKVLQLRTNSAPAIPRLGVQQYTYWSEGQHGLNLLGGNTNDGGVGGGVHATSFPTNFASSMSWDPELMYQATTAISDEARGVVQLSAETAVDQCHFERITRHFDSPRSSNRSMGAVYSRRASIQQVA